MNARSTVSLTLSGSAILSRAEAIVALTGLFACTLASGCG